MAIKFDELLDDEEAAVIDPRDIFLTLNRDKKLGFPRDIQTEVMKASFSQRDNPDTVVKLNVGSGKTLVGLLLLQSSLNEGLRPAFTSRRTSNWSTKCSPRQRHSASMRSMIRAIRLCSRARRSP